MKNEQEFDDLPPSGSGGQHTLYGEELVMKKKIRVAAIVTATVLIMGSAFLIRHAAVAGSYFDRQGASETENVLYDYGKYSQDLHVDSNVLSDEQLDKAAEIISLNSDKTKQEAKEQLAAHSKRTTALVQAATDAGYSVTEKEVSDVIAKSREAIDSTEQAKKELQAYLAGADKTEEEYWGLVRQDYEKTLLAEKYMTAQIKEKAVESNIAENTEQYYEKEQQWRTEIEEAAMAKYGEE